MNEDDKDRHGRTISDVILQNITLDCFLPVYVRPLPGIAFPSFVSPTSPSPAVKRAANAGSGKGVCQRRRRRRRPPLRGGLHPRRPSVRRSPVVFPCPKPIRSSAPSAATTTTRWPTKSVFLRMLCMRDYSEFKRRAEMR